MDRNRETRRCIVVAQTHASSNFVSKSADVSPDLLITYVHNVCEGLRARMFMQAASADFDDDEYCEAIDVVCHVLREIPYVAMRAMREVKSLMTNVMAKWKIVSQCASACESLLLRVMILCMHTRRFCPLPLVWFRNMIDCIAQRDVTPCHDMHILDALFAEHIADAAADQTMWPLLVRGRSAPSPLFFLLAWLYPRKTPHLPSTKAAVVRHVCVFLDVHTTTTMSHSQFAYAQDLCERLDMPSICFVASPPTDDTITAFSSYECPILQNVPRCSVLASDGFTYDLASLFSCAHSTETRRPFSAR